MKYFWYSEEVERMYKQAKMFTITFLNTVYAAYVIVIILPICMGSYPFDGDFPNFPYSFWFFSLMQSLQLLYDVIAVLAADCLFLCMACFVYSQFKMLNDRLEKLGTVKEIMYEEARICIQYHAFLLELVSSKLKVKTYLYSIFIDSLKDLQECLCRHYYHNIASQL